MSAADTPMIPPSNTPALSQTERVLSVFTAPTRTFTDLKRSTNWLLPFLLLSIVTVAYVFTVERKIGWEQIVDNAYSAMSEKQKSQLERMPEEAQGRQRRGMLMGFRYGSYAAPVFVLIFFAFLALVYLAVFNFGLGADVTFGQSLAIMVFASVPTLLRSVLAIVSVLLLSDPGAFNFENPVATNPGFLVNPAEHPALYSLLQKIDIFTLWATYLTGLGFACVSKVTTRTAMIVSFGVYGVWVLLAVGFNLLFR